MTIFLSFVLMFGALSAPGAFVEGLGMKMRRTNKVLPTVTARPKTPLQTDGAPHRTTHLWSAITKRTPNDVSSRSKQHYPSPLVLASPVEPPSQFTLDMGAIESLSSLEDLHASKVNEALVLQHELLQWDAELRDWYRAAMRAVQRERMKLLTE